MTNRAIRPGTMSTGIKNPINEAMVIRPVGRKVFIRNEVELLSNTAVNPLSEIFSCLPVEKCQLFVNGSMDRSNFPSWRLSDFGSIVVNSS